MAPPLVVAQPWSDKAGFDVLANLDTHDLLEFWAAYGAQGVPTVTMFADWRAAAGGALVSYVLCQAWRETSLEPFAVLALRLTGAAGVAEAAFLARDHRLYRREIATAGGLIRDNLAGQASTFGLHRVEARCWAQHPTAARFLRAVGFSHEADLQGFGANGAETFRQFAWVAPGLRTEKRS